jgi:hypothetical protein
MAVMDMVPDAAVNQSDLASTQLLANQNRQDLFVGFANTTQVSRERIISTLQTIIDRGDPVFIMDFFQD